MDVSGRTAIVTGAGSGIGEATAIRLGADGARVVVADIDPGAASRTVSAIEAAGGRAMAVRTDVASESDMDALFVAATEAFGSPDVMVNNAGVVEALDTQRLAFPDIEMARWSRMLDINLRGVILGTQKAIEAMRGRDGAIVNVASGAGIGFTPHDAPVYAASKAGVVRFTAALAPLADRMKVRVNCVCPGWVDTPMSRRGRSERSPEEWERIAPASMLQPQDIADSIIALIADDSLAGRVLLHYEGEAPRLLDPRGYGE